MTFQLFASHAPRWGLCFDWETSGSDWNGDSSITYQGLSLGMAVFDTRTFDVVGELYLERKFDASRYLWSKEAEAIHGLSREYLDANGLDEEEFVVQTIEFIIKYFGPNPVIMCMGHNIPYDLKFMSQLLSPHGLMFRPYHVLLDTAGVSFINFTTHKSDHLFQIAGVGERDTHNALIDVYMTIAAAKFMRDLVEEAVNGG